MDGSGSTARPTVPMAVLDVDDQYLGEIVDRYPGHLLVSCRHRRRHWYVPVALVGRVADGAIRLTVSEAFLRTGVEPFGFGPAWRAPTRSAGTAAAKHKTSVRHRAAS